MESVKVEIIPGNSARRLDAVIRVFWFAIIFTIVFWIIFIIIEVLFAINFFSCLLFKKRVGANISARLIKWIPKTLAYVSAVTDEKPPILP